MDWNQTRNSRNPAWTLQGCPSIWAGTKQPTSCTFFSNIMVGGEASISPRGAPAPGCGPPTVLPGWTYWERRLGLPHLPRGRLAPAHPEASPQEALGALRLALATDQVYDSVEALAHALQAQLPTFTPGQRHDPSFKMIKIKSYVVIAFCYTKANILQRWSNILHFFYGNKGQFHGRRSY